MVNLLRPVSRDKLSAICGGNQELIKFFENLFALTTSLATDGVSDAAVLAGSADNKASEALALVQSLADALNTQPAQQPETDQSYPLPVPVPYVQPQGWAVYRDGTYTSGSPFTIVDGDFVALPNDATNNIDRYIQTDTAALYNPGTQKITPRNVGDYYTITVRFKAVATNPNTALDFGIELGGSIGLAFGDTRPFPRGAGTPHTFSFTSPCYSLETFVANGGSVMLGPVNGDIDVYDIEYQIVRIFSALQGQA